MIKVISLTKNAFCKHVSFNLQCLLKYCKLQLQLSIALFVAMNITEKALSLTY